METDLLGRTVPDSVSSVRSSEMWAIVLIIAATVGKQSTGATIIREVFYPHHPVEEYYPAEQLRYQVRPQVTVVPVGQNYFYKEHPEHYHTDRHLAEDYHRDEDLKKSVHDSEKSALQNVRGAEGNHRVVVDTIGKHGHDEGAIAHKEAAEGKIASEKSKEYESSSKDGYGGQGSAGYNKGHKSTGFHKSYHNEESGKDYHYVDEDHKSGGENFGKSYDELFGEAGREGYSNANRGAGYKYSSSGGTGEGSALKTTALHDSKYGHHGRKSSYNNQDTAVRDDQAGSYHRGNHASGHNNVGRYEPSY